MNIAKYLDSTYLKKPEEAGISDAETLQKLKELATDAIDKKFFSVIILPNYLKSIREMINEKKSNVVLGTVIDFPEGTASINDKINEAQKAIDDGAEELDFVVNFNAFKKGDIKKIKEEIETCTTYVLKKGFLIKWIIETAALNDNQIINLVSLIREIVLKEIGEEYSERIFIKSSTGFFKTLNNEPNGANEHVIKLMLEHAGPLPIKASGGIRTLEDIIKMINIGVKRIGTSCASEIIKQTGDMHIHKK